MVGCVKLSGRVTIQLMSFMVQSPAVSECVEILPLQGLKVMVTIPLGTFF